MPRKKIRGNVTVTGSMTVAGTLTPALGNEFLDNAFAVKDNAAPTKKMAFQVSGVTAGETRVFTAPDYNGTLATQAGTETLTNKTLTAPVLNSPKIGSGLMDSAGNEVMETPAAALAVNQFEAKNAAAGAPVELNSKGDDAAVPIKIGPKGNAPLIVTGPISEFAVAAAYNDASDQAITAAQVLGKLILRDCNGAPRQDTLPTAAAMVAAIKGCVAGTYFEFVLRNTSAGAHTLTVAAPDAQVTISGTVTVAQNNTKRFGVLITNVGAAAEAYTAYSLGTSVF
jgi:hypothetical protein